MMRHNWFRSQWKIAFAEDGESCAGCHSPFVPTFPIMAKRFLELDTSGAPTGRISPVVETWHPSCFDLFYLERMRADEAPKIGTGGGKIVRGDQRDDQHPS